jgi:alpha-galactosidase
MKLLAMKGLRPDGRLLLRNLFVLTFLLLGALSAVAQTDISGVWALDVPTGDGNLFKMYFDLHQSAERVTGDLWYRYGKTTIIPGTFRDGKLHFEDFMSPKYHPDRKTDVDGTLEGNRLRVTITNIPGLGNSTGVGERTTADVLGLPPRLPLPELHDVPDNGLARTPIMGWNSYNKFAGKIDDITVRAIADAMVASGMKDVGYTYINIDESWAGPRDAQGNPRGNLKFPNMKALADYVHSKGLKIGLYSSPGPISCAGYPGSYGHEEQDARTYAAWGYDLFKYDWCSAGSIYKDSDMQAVYQKMGDALLKAGRPIVYSLCQYGREDVWNWGTKVGGNLWRTTGDIANNWPKVAENGFKQLSITPGQAGHWNDPDILEIGNGALTPDEDRAHMSLWSLVAAPLLAGNDLRSMSDETKSVLMNTEVIAINQDPAAKPFKKISEQGSQVIVARELKDKSWAVGLFNRADAPAKMTVAWADLGLHGKLKVRDLWAHKDLGKVADQFSADVPTHGVVLITVKH